jgi:hypothetical protein
LKKQLTQVSHETIVGIEAGPPALKRRQLRNPPCP